MDKISLKLMIAHQVQMRLNNRSMRLQVTISVVAEETAVLQNRHVGRHHVSFFFV